MAAENFKVFVIYQGNTATGKLDFFHIANVVRSGSNAFMDAASLATIVTLIIALSVASERMTEIIKGYIPMLSQSQDDPKAEARRRSMIQLLAAVAGIATSFLAAPALPADLIPDNWMSKFALGLLASGGSGMWNSIQGYMSQAKEVKKAQAEQNQSTVTVTETTTG